MLPRLGTSASLTVYPSPTRALGQRSERPVRPFVLYSLRHTFLARDWRRRNATFELLRGSRATIRSTSQLGAFRRRWMLC
jgi:hypothetical protein